MVLLSYNKRIKIRLGDEILNGNKTRLDIMMESIQGNHVYIQTHNFPDPDAIASAFGLQILLNYRGIKSTICYQGKIDKYSTKKMIETLNIEILPLNEIKDLNDKDEFVLIDSQAGNANLVDVMGNKIICIDHHPSFGISNYLYCDIRPRTGACASIIASYFIESDISITQEVATALMYGIKVDTANLSRGVSNLDLNMFYALYNLCDMDLINSLETSTLQFSDLNAYANAIKSIKVYDNISFANTGNHCPEPLIASISDFMMLIAGVNLCVVYSIKVDGIKISVRSDAGSFDAGQLTNDALFGIGSGGGHPTMAGGFVPFTELHEKVDELIEQIENNFIDTVIRYEKYNMKKYLNK